MDELKIDKSFVMDREANDSDAVIVRSTIDLAHKPGLQVVAEGVESREARDTLSIPDCDTSQGFFTGRPMPVDKLQTWLRESTLSPMLAGAIYAL